MIETITLITLTIIFLSLVRPGKTPPLDNPLTIERPGKYHMTLAPKLNLAQPFAEAIAEQFGPTNETTQHSATQFFEVRDNQVTAHGHDHYLLAITLRNGILHFQATSPQAETPDLLSIRGFAEPVLARFPATGEHSTALDERIVTAAQDAARLRNINIKLLAQ